MALENEGCQKIRLNTHFIIITPFEIINMKLLKSAKLFIVVIKDQDPDQDQLTWRLEVVWICILARIFKELKRFSTITFTRSSSRGSLPTPGVVKPYQCCGSGSDWIRVFLSNQIIRIHFFCGLNLI